MRNVNSVKSQQEGTVNWVEGWRLWSGLEPSEAASVGLVRDRALNAWGRAVSDR